MEIGPFNLIDAEVIKQACEARKVDFSVLIDKELEAQILADFNQRASLAPREMAGHLDLRIVFFEIPDTDYEKIKDVLEKYGILQASDGSYELGEG